MTVGGLFAGSLEGEWNGYTVPFLQGSEFQNLVFPSEWIYLPSPC